MRNGKLVVVELISELLARGGAETFFYSLAQEMSKREDLELHVVILYKKTDQSFDALFRNRNIKVHVVGKHRGIDFGCVTRFKRLIRSIQPDVINGHLTYLLTYCLAFGRKQQPFQLVHTSHSIQEQKSIIFKNYLNGGHRLSLIGVSDMVAKQSEIDFPGMPITTIYNGIPLSETRISETKVYDFVVVASLSPVKNHKMLIDSFAKYIGLYGRSTLLIVGGGPLLKETEQYAVDVGCQNDVTFSGPQNDVYPFLSKSKAFVLSSLREGNPISILEAMNAGLPIVSFAVGGVPDVIKDGLNGFLATPGNVDSFVEAMHKGVIFNKDNSIGRYNKEYVKRFAIENTAGQYVAYFYKLIEGKKK